MANTVLLKKSSVTSKVPLTTDLAYGEVALNYADGKLYFKNSSNVIKSFTQDDNVVTLTGSQTLTNKTLTSPTINGGVLSGTFTGAHTLSDTTASTSTSTGALVIGGGLGVGGSIYADQIRLTNNGAGTNVYLGDDVILGDINAANTLGVRGNQDASKGYIVFGNSNNTNYIGRDGTNPLQVTGQFKVDSGSLTGGSGVAMQIVGYAAKGGTGYHDFLSVTNNYVSATNPSKFFRLNSTGNLEIINSAYTTNIFTLTDSGTLSVPAISAGGSIGTAGQVLQSTGTGLQWGSVGGTGTVTSITAGTGLTGGTITSSGTIAIDSTVATLSGIQTLTNKTIAAASNTISGLTNSNLSGTAGISNANLANSSISINGSAISLGGSVTGLATTAGTLAQFAATTSLQLLGVISDETGSGSLVFATSPTLVTPTLGVASATSINKVAITAPATSATLTIADGKTLTASNTLTFTGTDLSSVAFGSGGTVVYTSNKLSVHAATTSAELAGVISDETGSGALVFGTSPAITTSLTTPSTSFDLINTTATTVNFAKAATALSIGATTGTTTINNDLTVTGNFVVNGSVVTVNATTITVDDKNIELGSVTTPTNTTADGGGITLKGTSDKTFNWINTTLAWTSSEHLDLATGKAYYIAGTAVLSGTALGTGVVTSSLTSVGTITSGTWSSGFGAVSGANLTSLTAGNLTGTIPAAVLGNSTVYIGSTAVALNRATGSLALTGISSIDGSAATLTTARTINGVSFNGSANITVTANTTNALTIGTGLSGSSFNGSGAVTIAIDSTVATLTGTQTLTNKTINLTSNTLVMTSAQLAAALTDETGSGANVFATSPTLVTPNIGDATATKITLNNGTSNLANLDVLQATVATVTATAIDTWALASFRSAKYTVQITQGTNYQVSEILVLHNGTVTFNTQYGQVETNGQLATFTTDIVSTNARLLVTMGSATSATINIQATMMAV